MPRTADFGLIAHEYDLLRPGDANWHELFDFAVREGGAEGLRILDAGCGTGRLAAALEARGASVHGVDISPQMIEKARERIGERAVVGDIGRLPFDDAEFDRVYMWRVVHLLDRPAAFAEIHRILAPEGKLVIVTQDPVCFPGYWLNRFFPSLLATDLGRFPTPDGLQAELGGAGFPAVRVAQLEQAVEIDRVTALRRVEGRFISTLQLISDAEFEEGSARLAAELPERASYDDTWAVVTAGVAAR